MKTPGRRSVVQGLGAGIAGSALGAQPSGAAEAAPREPPAIERFAMQMADSYAETYRAVTRRNFAVHRAALEKAGADAALLTMLDCALNTARAASMGEAFTMEWDAAYPMLTKVLTTNRGIPGRPNADASYHIAALHSDHTYRLSGNRGTGIVFDAIIHAGSMATRQRPLIDSLGLRNINIPPGQDIEIVLSRKPHDGLWLQLPEGDCFLYVRQYFYDWDTELPARLVIERDGAVYPPPGPTQAGIARGFELMNSWLSSNQDVASSDSFGMFQFEPNVLKPFAFATGAFKNVQYICGYSICRSDEAVVIEFEAPRARYWSINLNDAFGGALQPHMRQVSLNGHQAALDTDGLYRLVIAHDDPGVRNWLDTGGRDLTSLGVRLHDCEGAPEFRVQVVPRASLAGRLPKGTAMVSAAERQDLLRRRLRSAYRRSVVDF